MYNFYLKNCLRKPYGRGLLQKLLLIMKFTTLILITVILHVSAASMAQKVTIKANNIPLINVFDQISTQTGYDFAFTTEVLKNSKPVTISVKNEELTTVLTEIFQGQNLDFNIDKKTVVVKIKENSVSDRLKPVQAPLVVTGTVTDEHGNTLPGVTIKLKGTNLAWTTNQKGVFLVSISTPNPVLQFSFIGYLTQEIPAEHLKNPAVIVLKEDISKLDEVQVIAYGTTTKRANTGDISTINASTIAQYPTGNVLDALQGTVTGLTIYKNTGNANGSYKVQIRGLNGLTGGQPLYIVDGIQYKGGSYDTQNQNLGTGTANGTLNQGYDAMSTINPDDIESISILKDADATAIYGSRGADGVILITTKKGKIGATNIDASVYNGVTDIAHFQPVLNLQQYLQMRHEAKANDKAAISASDYDINGAWDTTRSTDWQKAAFGGFGHDTKTQLSISGGSELMQFRISGGYSKASNLEPLGGDDQTASLNLSLSSTTKNKKFSVTFAGGYFYDINTMPATSDITYDLGMLPPDAPPLYLPDGTLNYQNNTFANPLVVRNNIDSSPMSNLTSSLTLSYKPVTDLEIKLTTGYNKQSLNEFLGNPSSASPPYESPYVSNSFTYDNTTAWSIEPQANYNKKIGSGTMLATVGASLQSTNYSTMSLSGSGYSSDLLLSSLTAGTSITVVTPYSVLPQKFSALFGRVNYSWSNKYFIDLTGRDDGSSNFGDNKQFHLFAAAGAGWIFSEEKFIKNYLSFLSFGKLRGSYGSTGRDNITPYSFLSTYSSISGALAYGGVAGITPTRLSNPDLHWETTTKAELGLELQFMKGRIAFETNFYRNRTTGTLGPGLLSAVTGFNAINENIPSTVQNMGFDASLTTTNINSKNVSWTTTILFTRDRNKLLKYPDLTTSAYANLYVIGQPVNVIKAYRFGGVNPQTGIYQIYAANGSFTTAPNTVVDKTLLININPDFYGSVQNNFTYKQFRLSFLFRYIKQVGRNGLYTMGYSPPGSSSLSNYPTLVLNRWQKPGDITNIERYGTSSQLLTAQNNAKSSDAGYGDASYVRLQNLAFSYTLPQGVTHRMGMQNLQVFLQGDNLWTITGYNGLDPENQSGTALPPLRIITAGLRLTL